MKISYGIMLLDLIMVLASKHKASYSHDAISQDDHIILFPWMLGHYERKTPPI